MGDTDWPGWEHILFLYFDIHFNIDQIFLDVSAICPESWLFILWADKQPHGSCPLTYAGYSTHGFLKKKEKYDKDVRIYGLSCKLINNIQCAKHFIFHYSVFHMFWNRLYQIKKCSFLHYQVDCVLTLSNWEQLCVLCIKKRGIGNPITTTHWQYLQNCDKSSQVNTYLLTSVFFVVLWHAVSAKNPHLNQVSKLRLRSTFTE